MHCLSENHSKKGNLFLFNIMFTLLNPNHNYIPEAGSMNLLHTPFKSKLNNSISNKQLKFASKNIQC